MRPLLSVLLLLAASTVFAQSDSGRVWATAISTQAKTERKIIFRYVKEFQPTFKRATFPDRVIITWRYEAASGMPETKERERMDHLEDLLEPVTEQSGLATLVLVSTGENLREWTYYTKAEGSFLTALNTALASEGRFPIEIYTAKDAKWQTYEKFRAGVRE